MLAFYGLLKKSLRPLLPAGRPAGSLERMRRRWALRCPLRSARVAHISSGFAFSFVTSRSQRPLALRTVISMIVRPADPHARAPIRWM